MPLKILILLFILLTHATGKTRVVFADNPKQNIILKSIIKSTFTRNKLTIFYTLASVKNPINAFMKRITVMSNKNILFDISISKYFWSEKVNFISFKHLNIENLGDPHLKILYGNSKERNMLIKPKKSILANTITYAKIHPYKNKLNINPKIWESKDINKSIRMLYGKIPSYINDTVANNDSAVVGEIALRVKSNEKLSSIAIFSDMHPHVTAAIINIPSNIPIIDYRLSLGSRKSGHIIIIAQDTNGNFYKVTQKINQYSCIGNEGPIPHNIEISKKQLK